MESAVDVAAAAAASSEGDAWCPREAEWGPGVAAADADVAVDGLPAGCANPPLGCGGSAADVDAEAEKGFAPAASSSAFSSSDNMVFAALVMSFMSEISPICKGGGRRASRRLAPDLRE